MSTTVSDFNAEPILYGGIWTPRGEVIADLKESGLDDRCIDRYLQGNKLAQERTLGMYGAPTVVIGADEYPGEIWEPVAR